MAWLSLSRRKTCLSPAGLRRLKKQRRFSRDVATDVDWILNQGRTLGVRARLRHKLDYLWRSCTGELSEQNDLFRLTYALDLAKQYDWVYQGSVWISKIIVR